MQGDLNMGKLFTIVNIKPLVENESEDLDIKGNNEENVFSFVTFFFYLGKVDKDFYKFHKETYQLNINYDSKKGYYSTRLGIHLKAIDLDEYTLVFEMYINGSKIDKNELVVDAVSTSLNISRKNTNEFSDHSRTIINFHKYGKIGTIDLDIDIALKNKTGVSYDQVTTIYVVVYGVSGHQKNVDLAIWDRLYLIQNKVMKFEAGIYMNKYDITNVHNLSINNLLNMNKGQIKGLGDGNENAEPST